MKTAEKIVDWIFDPKPTPPWKFWNPKSGGIGGLISGLVIGALVLVLVSVGVLP